MVWSAVVSHSTLHELNRKTTSLSFVALERSTEVDPGAARNMIQVQMRALMPSGLTEVAPSDIEEFESTRTLLYQCHYHQTIFLAEPRQGELPEVDTAREGQQSAGESHSSLQVELKGSSEQGLARQLDGSWRPIFFEAIIAVS